MDNTTEIISKLERQYHWSMMRGQDNVLVDVDGKNCIICPTVESALKTLDQLCEARTPDLLEAIHSLPG